MWINMKYSRILLLAGFALLTACGGLTTSDKPVTRTWMLMPLEQPVKTETTEALKRIRVSIVAASGLDTNKILTLSGDSELNSFSVARWTDHAPELFESLIERALQASGDFDVVSKQADCDLHLEVQEFFAYTGMHGSASEVQIVLAGQHTCRNGNFRPVQLNASVPIQEEKMSVIVAAFQTGTDKVIRDLLGSL